MEKSKNCFVISPIGLTESPQRKRADIVLKYIFKAALESLGYTVVRADEISQPGSITLQVLERVLESELVVADLTDQNPNVFYELAVRHASQKPVIHVIASEQKIPFDVADLRTISIDMDLEGAERARQQIIAQCKEIEAGNMGETPVNLAGVLKHLAAGKSDEKVILKQLLDGITELRSDLRKSLMASMAAVHNQLLDGITELRSDLREGLTPLRERPAGRIGSTVEVSASSLSERSFVIGRCLEKRLYPLGDTVSEVGIRYDGTGVVFVDVTTKKGKSKSVTCYADAPASLIADLMLNELRESGKPEKKPSP